jgi:hypothetical protein
MNPMNNNDYWYEILRMQTLAPESAELKALQKHRADVEGILRKHFSQSSPTIPYGGSHAKGTMHKEAYDLDLIRYFPHDDTAAGETLEEIYNDTAHALAPRYMIERKPSALRLKDRDPQRLGMEFHIDIVLGRYIDGSKSCEMVRDNIRVQTTYHVTPVNPVEQTVEESITLEVEDAGIHTVLREILIRRDIYPQELLLLMANRSDFEFMGWWNNWDLTQPLDGTRAINRPITVVRKM